MTEPMHTTVHELATRSIHKPNERAVEACHLHFNGPGAAGFGVKRTAMLLPESAMLLIAPACCGRHGTITGNKTGFDDRIFYLQMDERDVVTGNYLKRIPQAAQLIAQRRQPKVLFLCMTCVDALLGTDLDRIARQVQQTCGLPVVGCFMDPITRESKNAPMVSVQQAIMQALEKSETDPHAVNLLGGFVPLDPTAELPALLRQASIDTLYQISACKTFAQYQKMGNAKLNLVIHPQAVASAKDLQARLGIPYVELQQTYGPDRTQAQIHVLEQALGVPLDAAPYRKQAEEALRAFAQKHKGLRIALGEAVNGNPLEIAETLLEAGMEVPFVLRNIITPRDREILARLDALHPELPIYSGVHPSTRVHAQELPETDVALGLDAGYFLPGAVSVCWNMERQTLGYSALTELLKEIEKQMANPISHKEQMHGSYLVV